MTKNPAVRQFVLERMEVAASAALSESVVQECTETDQHGNFLRLNEAKLRAFMDPMMQSVVVNLHTHFAAGCPQTVAVQVAVPANAWQHIKQHLAHALAWLDSVPLLSTGTASDTTRTILQAEWRRRLRVRTRLVQEKLTTYARVCPHAELPSNDHRHMLWACDGLSPDHRLACGGSRDDCCP